MLMPIVPDVASNFMSTKLELSGLIKVNKSIYPKWQKLVYFVILSHRPEYFCIGITGNSSCILWIWVAEGCIKVHSIRRSIRRTSI